MPKFKHPFSSKRRPKKPSFKRPFPPKKRMKPWAETAEGIAASEGFNLATQIAQGNFMTRAYRQKAFLTQGLETATHTPNPNRVNKAKKIPKVPTKNILLTVSTKKMPVFKKPFPPKKRSKKAFKAATNSKNTKKSAPQPKSVTKVIQKQVKDLQKAVKANQAIHTFKLCSAGSIKSLIGRCNHVAAAANPIADIETACANLRYYDPAAPGTLVTASGNTGSFARDIYFKDYYTKLVMRNNYQVPVRLKVYLCKVKNDCNESPVTTYTTAIADQVITASIDETDQLMYLTDVERVKEVWKVDCVVDKVLEPGQEASVSHATGPFNFDPSHVDSFTNAYQQVYKGFSLVVRIEGVLAHDTSAAEITLAAAGIDYEVYKKAVIEYDAGVTLNDIFISELRGQSFTNGGVSSLKPVADNIAYSVS